MHSPLKLLNAYRFILVLATTFIVLSCSSTKTAQYFKLEENRIDHFTGLFVKDTTDPYYRTVENIFGKTSKSDTIFEKEELIYKTVTIDGYKAFYAVYTKDTLKANPTIGPRYVFSCAMIFKEDTLLLTPAYDLNDLKSKHIGQFRYKIPPNLKSTDSIVIYDIKRKSILNSFKKETITVGGKRLKNCLHFKILEIWPETTYTSSVWLDKKYGLVKWIKTTGRIETRVF